MKLAKQKNDGQEPHSSKFDHLPVHNPAKELFHLWSNFENLNAGWDSPSGRNNW